MGTEKSFDFDFYRSPEGQRKFRDETVAAYRGFANSFERSSGSLGSWLAGNRNRWKRCAVLCRLMADRLEAGADDNEMQRLSNELAAIR